MREFCLCRKSTLYVTLFLALVLMWLWPSANVKAFFYADMEKSQDGHWIGYTNGDGTFTVAGCSSLDEFTDNILTIPTTIDGMTVTWVNGACNDPECTDTYCFDRTFQLPLFASTVDELVFPDTVLGIGYSDNDTSLFKQFTGLERLRLPNNDIFGEHEDKPGVYVGRFGFPTREWEKDIFPKLKEVSMRHCVISSGTQSVETIHFYEGATDVEGDNFPNLTQIDLPSTIQQFQWADSPKLSVLNCSRALSEVNIPTLSNCPNLCIEATADLSKEDWMFDSGWTYEGSGVTKVNLKNVPNGYTVRDLPEIDEAFNGCENLTAINVSSGGMTSRDGVLFMAGYLVKYPAGKSTTGDYTLPEDCIGICAGAFDNCKFTSVTIPEHIKDFDVLFHGVDQEKSFFSGSYRIRLIPGTLGLFFDAEDFAGSWSCFSGYGTEVGFQPYYKSISASRIELYKGSVYTISYVLGEGGRNPISNPKSYQAGDDIIELKDPERPGYTFLGWKRNDVSGDYMNTTQNMSQFQNYVFTAVWAKNEDKTTDPETPDSETADSETPESETTGSETTDSETTDPQTAGSETPSVPTGPLEQGSIIQGASGESYKVTGADTVEFMRPAKNKATVNVPNSIIKDGTSYIVTSIAPNAFKNNKRLKKVVINGNLQKIGANAFYGCKKLRTVSFTNGLTSIGPKAFYKCAGLTKVDLPSSLKSIGKQAFYGCKKLKKINIWMNQIIKNKIGSKAFSGIYKGVTVTIYNNRTKFKSIKMILNAKGMPAQAKYKSKISF